MDLQNLTPDEIKNILEKHLRWLRGEADGSRADLRNANLRNASLRNASLVGANLDGASAAFQIPPEEGAFIGWKRVATGNDSVVTVLKLEIPADAKRTSSLVGRKCRASKVKVLEAVSGANESGVYLSLTPHFTRLEYRVGQAVKVDNFDGDIRVECAAGIHFFITRAEAEAFHF